MKALTLQQPWATFMAIGAKQVETRAWPTYYRGPLAIHASAKWNREVLECLNVALKPPICDDDSDWRRIVAALVKAGYTTLGELPLGAVLCVVDVKGCCSTEAVRGRLEEDELAFGDYRPGRYAFITSLVCRLLAPVPFKGRLGLWEFPDELYPKPAAVYCGDDAAPAQPHGAAAGTDASGGPSGATGVTPSHATSAEDGLDRSGSTGAVRETDGR